MLRPTLSERSPEELQAMATEYRRMAGTGSTPQVTEPLLKIARRLGNRVRRRSEEATERPEGGA